MRFHCLHLWDRPHVVVYAFYHGLYAAAVHFSNWPFVPGTGMATSDGLRYPYSSIVACGICWKIAVLDFPVEAIWTVIFWQVVYLSYLREILDPELSSFLHP